MWFLVLGAVALPAVRRAAAPLLHEAVVMGTATALLEAFVHRGHQTRTSRLFPGKQERRVFYPPSQETHLILQHHKGGVLSRSPSCG